MNDEYEIFNNDDTEENDPHTSEKLPTQKKFTFNISIMIIVVIVSVCNMIMCMDLYKKINDLNIPPTIHIYENTTVANIQQSDDINEESTTLYKDTRDSQPTETTTGAETETHAVSTTEKSPISSGKININTATAEELTALTGIGEAKAKAIVEYRNENGKFSSVEELTNVSGIGEKTLQKNINSITVD